MFKILSIALFLLMSACSLLTTKKASERLELFTEAWIPGMSAEEIKSGIAKTASGAGGYYHLTFIPQTKALLAAKQQELVLSRGLDQNQSDRLHQSMQERYLNQRFCVEVNLQITRHKEALSLEQWQLFWVDAQGVNYPLRWLDTSAPVVTSEFMGSHGKEDQWHLVGTACVAQEVEFAPHFEIIATAPFMPWPFPKNMSATWAFYEEEAQAKEARRTYQRYRGY